MATTSPLPAQVRDGPLPAHRAPLPPTRRGVRPEQPLWAPTRRRPDSTAPILAQAGDEDDDGEETFASIEVDAGRVSPEDLRPAFDACETLAQFETAAEKFPEVIDVEPSGYVESACRDDPAVADSALCAVAG